MEFERKTFFYACIAFLPIFLYWLFKEFIDVRPYWVFYDHIETLYYYTSRELLEGLVPHNTDNPGTLVQILGVPVVLLSEADPKNYELFLKVAHILVLTLSFLSSLLLIKVTKQNSNGVLSIGSVWIYFSFLVSLLYLQVWGPEPFYYIFGVIFIAVLFWVFEEDSKITSLKLAVLGFSLGLLVSIKFTFLAWVPALCFVVFIVELKQGFFIASRQVIISVLGLFVGFFVVTFIVREKYTYMFGWIFKNATRNGAYGAGELVLPSVSVALDNWWSFVSSSKGWILIIAFMLFVVFKEVFSLRKTDPQRANFILYIAIFAVCSIMFSLLFVVRSYAQRYMLPVGLSGVMIYIIFTNVIRDKGAVYHYVACFALALLLVKSINNDYNNYRLKIQSQKSLRIEAVNEIKKLSKQFSIKQPVVIYGWRFPSPSFALRQQAHFEHHQLEVDLLYPNEGHFTPWPNGYRFRIPKNQTDWDFAVIRDDYLEHLKIDAFDIVSQISNYKIIKSKSAK